MKEYWHDLSQTKKIKLILTILLSLSIIIFAFRNWNETEVILVFVKVRMPLTIVILFSAVIGFLISVLFGYKKNKLREAEIKRLNDKILQDIETKRLTKDSYPFKN